MHCGINIDWNLLVTFLAALATIATVWEMKKQREQSNLPDLIIHPDKKFYLHQAISNDNFQFWYWHENFVKDSNLIESIRHLSFDIDLFNIGIGSAKNVSFKYHIDADEMKSIIEKSGTVHIDKLELSNPIIFEAKLGEYNLGYSEGMIALEYSHIFVPHTSEKSFKITLPGIYLYLFNAYILSLLNNLMDNRSGFPSLHLKISYQDIANKFYTKKFILSFLIDSVSVKPQCVSGVIKVNHV